MLKGLIIDDSKMAQKIIGKSLEGLDVSFEYADDGQEAIDILSSQRSFDFIITDLSMPKVDGDELLERIRSHDHETPIYIITSRDVDEVEDELILKGGDAVFNKMDMEKFSDFIREKLATAMKVLD